MYVCMLASLLTVFAFGVGGASAVEVVIDNLDGANTSSTGVWQESGGQYEYLNSSYWARNGATFSFIFHCEESGDYDVLEWHSMWSSRSDDVLMTIEHDGGPTEKHISQQAGGQTWNSLGTYAFSAGSQYLVTITASDGSTVSTAADAVMFRTAVPGNTPPVANDDTADTVMNTPVAIDVLANDTDAEGHETIDVSSVSIAAGTVQRYSRPATGRHGEIHPRQRFSWNGLHFLTACGTIRLQFRMSPP